MAKKLELHLRPLKPAFQQPRRQLSDEFSLACICFRFILSSLHNSSSLQTLLLSHVQVAPAHQRLILAIKTLRRLILQYSEFVPTSVTLPSSSITSLSLHGVEPAATAHVLTLLSNSIETLDCTTNIYHILSNIRLPRLTSLWSLSYPEVNHLVALSAFMRLTSLTIGSCLNHCVLFPDIPPAVLPHLRHLCTSWDLGERLVIGRPVHTFSLIWEIRSFKNSQTRLVKDISQFAAGASHLEELQIPLTIPVRDTIEIISQYLPHITRLHLWTLPGNLPTPQYTIPFQWIVVREHIFQHPSLKEVTVGFAPENWKQAAYITREAPGWSLSRPRCAHVFDVIVEKCPVVEVVRIGTSLPWIDAREVPREWVMEWRKGESGEWVERR